MKSLDQFIVDFEAITLHKEKLFNSKRVIYLQTAGVFILLVALSYLVGLLLNLLSTIGYLISMANLSVLVTFCVHKILINRQYKIAMNKTYSIKVAVALDSLYFIINFFTSTMLLLLTVFLRAVSPVTIIIYLVLLVSAIVLYNYIYKHVKEITIPHPLRLIINGLFIGILFYTITMVIHINNMALSMVIAIPLTIALILIKEYIIERFIIRFNRLSVFSLGLFLVILSFPFTTAFTYTSFYRQEFTFRIVYETFDNPVYELPEDATGEVHFYGDYFVVVDDEEIKFFDKNLTLERTIDNEYASVYVLDDELYATQEIMSGDTVIAMSLLKYDMAGDTFTGKYYPSVNGNVVATDDTMYFSNNGYVYEQNFDSQNYNLLEMQETDPVTILDQTDDFIAFQYPYPYLATSNSFRNDVQGLKYDNIAYNNNHLIFYYLTTFIHRNSASVDPLDRDYVLLYLTHVDDYFDSDVVPVTYHPPRLFRISDFHYVNNSYYLAGFVEYVTGDKNNTLLIVNNDGEFEKEIIFYGSNIAIDDEYIAFDNNGIKVFPVDADTVLTYRIIEGYGIFFVVMGLVALVTIEDFHLNPKKFKMKRKIKRVIETE